MCIKGEGRILSYAPLRIFVVYLPLAVFRSQIAESRFSFLVDAFLFSRHPPFPVYLLGLTPPSPSEKKRNSYAIRQKGYIYLRSFTHFFRLLLPPFLRLLLSALCPFELSHESFCRPIFSAREFSLLPPGGCKARALTNFRVNIHNLP